MSQPFYQPARQSFSFSQNMQQPQGFGGGQGFGGFQQQSWGGGFGGNQGFGGFGGGGFQPQGFGFGGGYGGGFGGFQPQQQFNPYQGGFGGFGGFGGGYNPMFGGIGGLGFNPMMGPQFGMPMQGFNPYQQQVQLQQPQQNPFVDQQQQLRSQVDALPEYQALQNAQRALESSDAFKSIQQKQQELGAKMHEFDVQQNREQGQRMRQAQMPRDIQTGQPMYGGIGGLGFNPMMGPQFGMPMQGRNADVAMTPAMMQSMIPPQVREAQMREKQQQQQQDAELEKQFGISKFSSGLGGFRYTEDYEQSPELSAFKQSPEYQRAMQNKTGGDYGMDGPRSVDIAFKNWLYKNRQNISSGALGFQSEATKARQEAVRKQMEAQNKYYEDLRNRPKFDPSNPLESLRLMQADLNTQQNSPIQGGGPFGYMPAMLG